ncbi:hypothetical protein ACEWY4_000734 [Coilia grayii]|uniref:STAS domain-containing protein n=1 Tax=Coilia grayii TaxID=363190 RepID=A0ABD1KXW6_9TELE
MSALVSALLMLVILLKIGALFEQLPKAVLAVIILVNLQGIFAQVKDVPVLWSSDRIDLARQIPGVTIFSFSNPIYYANSDPYFSSVREVIQRGLEENACPTEGPAGQQTEGPQHCVILEFSGVSFMDSVAVNKLRTVEVAASEV